MVTKPDGLSWADWDAWPACAVKGCQNKSCLSLNSRYCWPHTSGTPEQALENLMETEIREAESDAL